MTDLQFFKSLKDVERAALLEFTAIYLSGSDPSAVANLNSSSGFNGLFLHLRKKLFEHRRARRQGKYEPPAFSEDRRLSPTS